MYEKLLAALLPDGDGLEQVPMREIMLQTDGASTINGWDGGMVCRYDRDPTNRFHLRVTPCHVSHKAFEGAVTKVLGTVTADFAEPGQAVRDGACWLLGTTRKTVDGTRQLAGTFKNFGLAKMIAHFSTPAADGGGVTLGGGQGLEALEGLTFGQLTWDGFYPLLDPDGKFMGISWPATRRIRTTSSGSTSRETP